MCCTGAGLSDALPAAAWPVLPPAGSAQLQCVTEAGQLQVFSLLFCLREPVCSWNAFWKLGCAGICGVLSLLLRAMPGMQAQ